MASQILLFKHETIHLGPGGIQIPFLKRWPLNFVLTAPVLKKPSSFFPRLCSQRARVRRLLGLAYLFNPPKRPASQPGKNQDSQRHIASPVLVSRQHRSRMRRSKTLIPGGLKASRSAVLLSCEQRAGDGLTEDVQGDERPSACGALAEKST